VREDLRDQGEIVQRGDQAQAQTQVTLATDDGLYPEAERMKQLVRDCDTELEEMDQIDAYRRDEAHAPHIHGTP